MNTHLTIGTVLATVALAVVIGMTSTLSVAQAGEGGAQRKTLGSQRAARAKPLR